jgi:hypothetical protein
MARTTRQPKNIIFWGAGATHALGIRTTARQQHFIRCITGAHDSTKPLKGRIKDALGLGIPQRWHDALFDLITILGDSDKSYDSINEINRKQLQAMGRNWTSGAREEELKKRIIDLRLIYDWPALKSAVSICPGSATDKFRLNDLFNLLDMHIPPGFGFHAPSGHLGAASKSPPHQQFFDARRLIGAKNALLVILIASFYIDYQVCIHTKKTELSQYYEFAMALGRRMQKQGRKLATKSKLDQPLFYCGDVGFVSLNYDPIALWAQFFANRTLNNDAAVPRVGSPTLPLHLFHDFGHLIPARRIEKGEDDWPWYPLNEGAAQRLNELKHGEVRIRLTKFLFPHGCLCWRECPDCGKLSAYHGDSWKLHAPGLFPPPPLRAFDTRDCADWITGDERVQRRRGKVDARKCLHCGTLTYAHHTQAVMQSSFKPRSPSFIEEIQRELRATTMQANHIIFMGYSLPPDDVTYRAFFSARSQRQGSPVQCTVVDFDQKHQKWYGPDKLKRLRRKLPESSPVHAACDIFGEKNVRFFGGGVPNVFFERGKVTQDKLDKLLTWESIS